MKREYPYLHDTYFTNTATENKVTRSILRDIEDFVNQKQYIRITLLDWKENPIKEIQGELTSGSLSKVAQSPIRRSGNLSVAIDARSYSVEDSKADFAINKKIFIEIGIRNDTDKYPEYPIFWFPEGVFFIGSFSMNSSSGGSTNINLTIKDKMAMLNGEVGGTLPATVTFDTMDTQLPDGTYATQKVLIYNIIQELVNHFGKESLNNIVIEDVPLRIRRVMQWTGDKPLYFKYVSYVNQEDEMDEEAQEFVNSDSVLPEDENYDSNALEGYRPFFTLTKPADEVDDQGRVYETYRTYYAGDDVGYVRDNFVVTGELVGNAGETVTQILDKIINILGNYEYFYDVFGIFHFREIKNYLNHTLGEKALAELNEKDYLVDVNQSKNVFSFSDETLLTSVTVTPLYENIKNDYIIEGLHENPSTGITRNVRYHLAIDKKPRPVGVDNRQYIKSLWDRTEDIEKVQEAITELNRQLSLIQANRQRQLNLINSYKRVRLQRYEQLASHGDTFKERLHLVLGDYSSPQNQDLQEEEKQAYFTEDDYYLHLVEDVIKEALDQNSGYSSLSAINKIDELFIKDLKKDAEYLSDTARVKNFSSVIFESIFPESYWKLLSGVKIDEEDKDENGILQTAYIKKITDEYSEKKKKWDKAVSLVEQGQINKFEKIRVDYKNPQTGYTKESENLITDNACNSIERPASIEWLKKIPSAKELNEKISSLEHFFELDIEDSKIAKEVKKIIETLYSADITLLPDSTESEKNTLEQLKENKQSYEKKKLEAEITKNAYKEFLDKYKKYDEKDPSSVMKVTFKYNPEDSSEFEKEISNVSVQYTDAEGYFKNWSKTVETYELKIANLEKRIAVLEDKIAVGVWPSIFSYLKEYWDKYIEEKQLIQEYTNKIDSAQEFYNNGIFDTPENIANIISNLGLNGIYDGLSLIPVTSSNGEEILKYEIPLVLMNNPNLKKITERLNAYYISYVPKDKSLTYKEENKYNMELVYSALIEELNNILNFWSKNPNFIALENPRKGTPYYHIFNTRTMVLYEEEDTGFVKAGFCYTPKYDEPSYNEELVLEGKQVWPERPEIGNFNLIYQGDMFNDLGYYYWDGTAYKPLKVKGIFYHADTEIPLTFISGTTEAEINLYGASYCVYDWRTFLYLQGVYAKINGTDKGYYFEELDAFWPEVYDLKNQWFYGQEDLNPNNPKNYDGNKLCSGYYFLDFLDSIDTTYGIWSVDNIGRRTDVISNNEINCLFEPEIPNINILNSASCSLAKDIYSLEDEWTLERLRKESINEGEPYTQVGDDIFDNLTTGGYRNSAYEQLKYELYLHTRYQKSVSVSSIPVFYLEPNSRVTILDSTTQTFGDFVIQSINLTFGPGANMSISATETLERF